MKGRGALRLVLRTSDDAHGPIAGLHIANSEVHRKERRPVPEVCVRKACRPIEQVRVQPLKVCCAWDHEITPHVGAQRRSPEHIVQYNTDRGQGAQRDPLWPRGATRLARHRPSPREGVAARPTVTLAEWVLLQKSSLQILTAMQQSINLHLGEYARQYHKAVLSHQPGRLWSMRAIGLGINRIEIPEVRHCLRAHGRIQCHCAAPHPVTAVKQKLFPIAGEICQQALLGRLALIASLAVQLELDPPLVASILPVTPRRESRQLRPMRPHPMRGRHPAATILVAVALVWLDPPVPVIVLLDPD
mmetsp:Transcript_58307/g.125280  ORF Transcript_58307/g.125280 Transcript_58307/m.125280 type:complete len:303 (-) Transcript_58307:282-1190(-)